MKPKQRMLFPGIFVFVCVLVTAIMAPGTTQKSTPTMPEVKPLGGMPTINEIIEKHVQAMGGKNALEKLITRIMTLSVRFDTGEAGSTIVYAAY